MPLVLTHKWFDMIDKGDKREEYRLCTPRYEVRLRNISAKKVWNEHVNNSPKELVVAFQRGYTKPSMFWTFDWWLRPNGRREHPEWGEPDAPHWVLRLLERVKLED